MSQRKAKILRYEQVDVETVFNKECELLSAIQNNALDEALILWQTRDNTLVLPSGNKWQATSELKESLNQQNWQLYSRKTGGAPVPQTAGVINVSYLYALPETQHYSIPEAYSHFCSILSKFFAQFDVEVTVHATAGSYCDGDYNLNIAGKKIVGTAQRVVLKKGGGKVVLAQACILINVDVPCLIEPVNLCYRQHQQTERVKAEVHTTLFNHIDHAPTLSELYQALINSFAKAVIKD